MASLARREVVKAYQPEENSDDESYSSDNSDPYQTNFDQKGCLFPVRFLGDVKESLS